MKIYEVEIEVRYIAHIVAETREAALELACEHEDEIIKLDSFPDSHHSATEVPESAWDSLKGEGLYGEFEDVGQLREFLREMAEIEADTRRCTLTIDMFGGANGP